jgi:hypothetical protein
VPQQLARLCERIIHCLTKEIAMPQSAPVDGMPGSWAKKALTLVGDEPLLAQETVLEAILATMPLGERHERGEQGFLPVAEIFFPSMESWDKELAIALQMENGQIYRIKLSSNDVGTLLKHLAVLGVLLPT